MLSVISLNKRINDIQGRIIKAAINANRNPQHITLVAVTKSHPRKIWEHALNANLTHLGENRILEAQKKSDNFHNRNKIELHLIGHLQSNKVRKAVNIFDIIQTVDSIKIARRINNVCKENSIRKQIFIQVNTGKDDNKFGFSTKNAIIAAREITKMKNLHLSGIMTIPPIGLTTTDLSFIYRKTNEVRNKICSSINDNCKNLSMGMSNDYEIAIAEGATHIRIGTSLFGSRKP